MTENQFRNVMIFMLATILAVASLLGVMLLASSKAQGHDNIPTLEVLFVIPLTYNSPDAGLIEADADTIALSEDVAKRFNRTFYGYTDKMAKLHVDIMYLEYVPSSLFSWDKWAGGTFVQTTWLRAYLGGLPEYDVVVAITDVDATTAHFYSTNGLTPIDDGRGFWVAAYEDSMNVAIHELAHVLEFKFYPLGLSMWPTCAIYNGEYIVGGSIHCSQEWGYAHDKDAQWFEDYFSADIPGGYGINEATWNTLLN